MRAIVLAGVVVLAGCGALGEGGADQVAECEAFIKGQLRSPSSYERIELSVMDSEPLTAAEFAARNALEAQPSQPQLRERTVVIGYDAQNGFGALIREQQMCKFAITEEMREADMAKPIVISREIEEQSDREHPLPPMKLACCLD